MTLAVRPELIPLDAATLVEASAGTGKTFAITTYFVRGILEHDLEPKQILVVTYTRAATAELRARARKRIAQAIDLLDAAPMESDALHEVVTAAVETLGRQEVLSRLRRALAQMDEAAILTIHGFCQRLLQEHPIALGADFDFEVAEDSDSMLSQLAVDFWTTELFDAPEWLLRALHDAKVGPELLAKLGDVAALPEVEILGPEPQEVDQRLVEAWSGAHRSAAALWTEARDSVLAILLHYKGLNGNSYRAATIENTWLPELDVFFDEPAYRPLPKFFERLAQSKIKVNKGVERPQHAFFEACEALWEANEALSAMLRYAVFSFERRFIERVRAAAVERRNEAAVFTYDDLLSAIHEALVRVDDQAPGGDARTIAGLVRKAYPLALVDEFQDTDSIQYGIFRAIYGEGRAVYVGDPKQAIYAFRGADIFSYIGAADDIGERRHTLTINWRSDPGVVDGVNALFSKRHPPFKLDQIGFPPVVASAEKNRSSLEPPLDLVFVPEERLTGTLAEVVAPLVANEIALLLESGAQIEERPVSPGDVAVLCRSNSQTLEVMKALRALNIPASLDGGSSVLETKIANDLRAVLGAALMPGDTRAVRRALLTSLLGVSPEALASMDDVEQAMWASRFAQWHETWHGQGVLRFVEDMLGATRAEDRIARGPSARRDLTDLLHLEELLLRGERERRRNPMALMQWLRRLSAGATVASAVAPEDLQRRPDAEAGAVRVATIHKSKGLEYGIVYCPFTWNDSGLRGSDTKIVRFHDDDHELVVDLGSEAVEEHKQASAGEAAAEALRLLYVAVTRAKHQCTLFWGRHKRWRNSALAYLLHEDHSSSKKSEDEMRAEVEAFARGSGGAIGCRPLDPRRAARRADVAPTAELRARTALRGFSHAARIASFTSLTGHDEKAPRALAERASVAPAPSLFPSLPGGARTGLLLHSILEEAPFDALDSEESTRLIERLLGGYGFDASLVSEVQSDLVTVGTTPMMAQAGAPRLRDLSPDEQLRELEFTLSAGQANLAALATLLEEHGAPAAAPSYPDRLRELGGQALQRFLRGFIDLVFRWEGRWYVADYKSNKLPTYDQASVIEAVVREHYLLQAQLYSAAAQRHLRQRIPQYDPERHWGGALFLFVRGMQGPAHAGQSVFFERQSPALLDAIDVWLGGPA